MHFRGDINGLRAIAVIAVMLFHFGVVGGQGGFVGVDVFFVISGFLMTGIIFSRLDSGRFSVWDFYKARAKRIVPALAFLCLCLFATGWVLLLPSAYEQLGKHVLGSLGFISNLMYWKEAGYFEQASHDNWLLHTWSLSVEWQFYLVYPIVIVALRKMVSLQQTRWLLILLALGSFALSVYASSRWPTSSFFLLPTRMWEMLAGGLVYLFPLAFAQRSSRVLELSGILLIVASVLAFSPETVWPGWLALIPVIGTVMVIYSARYESRITGNAVSQFMGRISYSVYLWHWPIAVWIYYFALEGEPFWIITGMAASILTGWLSFHYIENRVRHKSDSPGLLQPGVGAAGAVVLACSLATVTLAAQGYPSRVSDEFRQATADLILPRRSNGWCFHNVETSGSGEVNPVGQGGLECLLGAADGQLQALLFGDSFAGHYGPFWHDLGKEHSISINSVSTNWCYPSLAKDFTGNVTGPGYQQCLINRGYLGAEAGNYDLIILAGQWGAVQEHDDMRDVFEAIDYLAERTGLVILMASPTTFDVNVAEMYKRSLRFGSEFDITRFGKTRDAPAKEANRLLADYASRHANVMFIDRHSMFHVNGVRSDVTAENVPFGLDPSGHISLYGSRMAAKAFRESAVYEAFLEGIRAPGFRSLGMFSQGPR
ncbi:acyltransferase family protein [Pseudomonas sp. OIL-1]|uniref:acyltransferase family protein n=1 Tax=Pseudomonas sp. OIL-1 TaxID=2706126 RepID=UPI0013A74F6A|nr:acyltransferase family protein [Pseudomonas sp. OIL-1]QIB49822.1 acyltransferase [Pseudomonas sp. OIL-1]